MEFWQPPPFALTEESGTYYMDWAVLPDNVGYTQAEVEAQVGAVLSGALGWQRAGVVARHNTSAPKVVFEIVTEAEGESPEAARTFWDETPVRVSIEEQYLGVSSLGWQNLINHESGHAFFSGTHEGSFGIMNDFGDGPSRVDVPSDAEIAAVEAWLGDTGDTGSGEGTGGVLWFPGDLEGYWTLWSAQEASEFRLTATVIEGAAGTALKAVWGRSVDAMREGRLHDLTAFVPTSSRGFVASSWRAVPAGFASEGEVIVGIIVRRTTAGVDLSDLAVGLAEVQLR